MYHICIIYVSYVYHICITVRPRPSPVRPRPSPVRGGKHKFHALVGPPAAIFENNNNLQNQEGNFEFLRMALNHVLIVPEYSRHSQLQESCLNIFHLPIFDRFMAYRRSKKNLGPNVIYCFLGYMDIVWRYHMVISYDDIVW